MRPKSSAHKAKSLSASLKLPEFFERAASFLTPIDDHPPDEWASQNRSYSSKTGEPGPRNAHLTPYMVPFARRIWARTHASVIAITSAQSGKTDTLLDVIGQRLDVRPAPILYVGPGESFVETQFEPRLEHMLKQAPRLAAGMGTGKQSKTLVKKVRGVRVRLGYAGSPASMKSDPFAIGIVDEYDEMAANIRGQGDPWGLVVARGDTFADTVTVVISTCTRGIVETEVDPVNGLTFWAKGDPEQIQSPIWRLFQQGTRHHWAWPCHHCGEYFIPMRSHLRWKKGADATMAKRTAFLLCPAKDCGGVLENDEAPGGTDHKTWMNERGVMVAPGQTIEDALADRNHPLNDSWSQWASGLASPFVTWGERARRLVEALESHDENKVQTAVNASFAELYTPGAGGELPEWQELLNNNRLPVPRRHVIRQVIRVVAGVDVGKRGLYYVVRGFGARASSWLLDHGFLHGLTEDDAVWSDLATMMLAPIGGMQIERVFIDSGFRPDKPEAGSEHRVYEFCRRYSFLCSPTKGRDTLGGRPYYTNKIEVKPDGSKKPYSLDLVHLNSDFFKSLVHARVKTPIKQTGAFFLHEEADEEYARQVLSEVRVVEAGSPKARWVKQRRDNHFLDCEALAAAAGYSLNVHTIPEGTVRTWGEDDGDIALGLPVAAEPTGDNDGDVPPPDAPTPPADAGGGIRNRFRNFGSRMR